MSKIINLTEFQLTTAKILYFLPDHPSLLQSFIWQDHDIVPTFPVLKKFLQFWDSELDAKLHLVEVAALDLGDPYEFAFHDFDETLN